MKYWIALTVLAALLLTGCTGNSSGQIHATSATENTMPDPGCYVSESVMEQQTGGAVRQYRIEQADNYALDFMGQDVVLLYSAEEGDVFVNRFTGENCAVAALGNLPGDVKVGGSGVRVEGRTMAYFNAGDNSVVYLNDCLQEIDRRKLPHTTTRQPVLGKDLSIVFYNISSEIYAADMKAGIARLVRQYESDIPVVEQTLFDDSILLCRTVNAGSQKKLFISAATGSPVGTDNGLKSIAALNQTYCLSRNDGIVGEILFGTIDTDPKLLLPQENGNVYPALSMNGVVAESFCGENGTLLGFYDLSTGARCSQVQLSDVKQILALDSDDSAGYVWILALDSADQKILLRWDVKISAIEDGTDHSLQRYTLENLDQEGVSRCYKKAEEISKAFGVNVVLLQDVKQPQDAQIQYEYQVEAMEQGLVKLEEVLSKFPEGFFTAMQEISGKKGINIGLVRSVTGSAAEAEGFQYWLNGEAHIALIPGDNFEKAAIHELSHVLDTYIYTNSILYDAWNEVNPAGFQYDENYEAYLTRENSPYLREGSQSFVDSYSMSFAKEDRARILEYALTEGNEAVFASSSMQNKLLRVCRAIRDAYGWKKDTRTFPWEQYLNKSLAYVEKKK